MVNLADSVTFDRDGLIPVAITDHESERLLVLSYMNREALERTVAEGKVYVYRRSKGRIALKGETSGHVQKVKEIRLNCEENSIEVRVQQHIAACHAGYFSCYYRRWNSETGRWDTVDKRIFDPDQVYA
ncbi:MAG: phosphoribosyl-AMP cyclohydrolase [Candidatus Latescibacterota bacterium]|nr:phosphoribosyl-AMP cyclohydrolase [Candidatus Latescibacterota bacterium]